MGIVGIGGFNKLGLTFDATVVICCAVSTTYTLAPRAGHTLALAMGWDEEGAD